MSAGKANGGFAVLVMDMARTGDPEDERLVQGFVTFDAARAYADARVRASVEELRAPGQTGSDLRYLWHLYGEDCSVVGGDWSGRDELDRYIAEPSTPQQCDWPLLAPENDADPASAFVESRAAPPPLRRFHAVVLVSDKDRDSVWTGGFLRLARKPSAEDLIAIYRTDAIEPFARKGSPEAEPASIHVAHLHELPDPPRPEPGDTRPLRTWRVTVEFVCHDIKFGLTTGGVFLWPDAPAGAVLDAMVKVVTVDALAVRGDAPHYFDHSEILSTRVAETADVTDYPI